MKLVKMAFISAAMLLVPLAASASISEEFNEKIDRGLEMLYQGQYPEAIDTFDAFISRYPANPAGYFFKAGVIQMRAMAYESGEWDRELQTLLDSSLELSSQAISRDRKDAWAYFIKGGSNAYRAAARAKRKDYLGALSSGLAAVSDLNRSVEIDSQLYDAYLGIGSFHYFRTKATSVLKWLPFIGDNREKGIAEIKLSIENGRYSRVMAQNGLAWIFVDYGKFQQALELAEQLEKEHPRNHTFFWIAPEVYWRTRQWGKAAEAYARLLQLVDDGKPVNNYNRVYVGCRLAKCLYQSGKYLEASEAAKRALELSLDANLSKRLQYERGTAYQIQKKSEKRMKEAK